MILIGFWTLPMMSFAQNAQPSTPLYDGGIIHSRKVELSRQKTDAHMGFDGKAATPASNTYYLTRSLNRVEELSVSGRYRENSRIIYTNLYETIESNYSLINTYDPVAETYSFTKTGNETLDYESLTRRPNGLNSYIYYYHVSKKEHSQITNGNKIHTVQRNNRRTDTYDISIAQFVNEVETVGPLSTTNVIPYYTFDSSVPHDRLGIPIHDYNEITTSSISRYTNSVFSRYSPRDSRVLINSFTATLYTEDQLWQEYTTHQLKDAARTAVVTEPYSGAWNTGLNVALNALDNSELTQTVSKITYYINVDTTGLTTGQQYTYYWVERFVSEDGSVTNHVNREFNFVAAGTDVRTSVTEILPPIAEGSIRPILVQPDFLVTSIAFDKNPLVPAFGGVESKAKAWAAIGSLTDPAKESEYLARIHWKVVAVKNGWTYSVEVKKNGVENHHALAEVFASIQMGSVYIMAYDSLNPAVYAMERLEVACSPCADGSCGVGSGSVENECLEFSVNLGKNSDGSSVGKLMVLEQQPDAYIYTPHSLKFSVVNSNDTQLVRDEYGALQQVYTAQMLVDISVPEALSLTATNHYISTNEFTVTTNTVLSGSHAGYEISLYQRDQVVGFSDGTYVVVSNAAPFKVWRVEDPDRLQNNFHQVTISEISYGEVASKTNESLFVWSDSAQGWSLSKGDGLLVEDRSSVIEGNERVERVTVRNSVGRTASVVDHYYRTLFSGELLIKTVQDPDGTALTTEYTYYTDESDPARAGKLESERYPDGAWIKYLYDDVGRQSTVLTPWKDITLDQATPFNARREERSYIPVNTLEIAQTQQNEVVVRPRLITQYIEGTAVFRTAYAYYTNQVERVEQTVEYADPSSLDYTAAGNRVSSRSYYLDTEANRDAADRMKQTISPEGLTSTYSYTRGRFSPLNLSIGLYAFSPDTNGTDVMKAVVEGVVSSPDGIAGKTTKAVSFCNVYGAVCFSETYLCTGIDSYERIRWNAAVYDYDLDYADAVGQVINRYYSDGTYAENTWSSCCGLERTITRLGQEMIYSYDALDRRDHVYQAGLGIDAGTLFDAAGRRLSTTETSSNGLVRTDGNTYDLSGRILFTTNEAERVTSYRYEAGGRITRVELPGGVTQITENYIDGRTKRIYGTGTVEQFFEYGLDSSNLWTTVYLGAQGTNSARWEKTTTAADEKVLKVERPGFGGELISTLFFYDSTNRLWKTEQREGGVVKQAELIMYNGQGQPFRSGLDMNLDHQLTTASLDRIVDTEPFYMNTNGCWYQGRITKIYPKDKEGTAITVSAKMSRLTGLGGSGIYGVLTAEEINRDIFGNKTITSTWLDRGKQTVTQVVNIPTSSEDRISVSVNGLLKSVQSASAAGLTRYGYDALGRQTSMVDPRIGTFTRHFDVLGQLEWSENAHGVRTGYTYNSDTGALFLTSVTNGAEVSNSYTEYDLRGQLKHQWGSAVYPMAYDFDELGQRTHMHTFRGGTNWTDSAWSGDHELADTTEWLYDSATGVMTNKVYADGNGTSFDYYTDGKLKTRTWARLSADGNVLKTQYTYFDSGDLNTINYSDDTPDISYTYNRLGYPEQITDGQGIRTFGYTDLGLPDTETLNGVLISDRMVDEFGRSSGFDADDLSSRITYGYDRFGRFSTITSTVNTVTSIAEYAYVPNAELLAGYSISEVGSPAELRVTKNYEADRNRVTGITNQIDGGAHAGNISSFTYVNDDLGRRTQRTDIRAAGIIPALSVWDFGYNARSELTNAVRRLPEGNIIPGQAAGYRYDLIGNRRQVNKSEDQIADYTVNKLNQYDARTIPSFVNITGSANTEATVTVRNVQHSDLPKPVDRLNEYFYTAYPVDNLSQPFDAELEITAVMNPPGTNEPDLVSTEIRPAFVTKSPESFAYDLDGNRLRDGRFNYTWNAENRLTSVSNAVLYIEYQYDYQGRRVSKTVNGEQTQFLWNNHRLVREFSPSKTNIYCWGAGDQLIAASLNGTNIFYSHDANKNVTDLVGADGAVLGQYEYDSFGKNRLAVGELANANPFRFSNEYFDQETGLTAYQYRYYQPDTGNFLNRDPIGEQGGINLYGFVHNSPINYADQQGLVLYAFDGTGNVPEQYTHVRMLHDVYGGTRVYEEGVGSSWLTKPLGGGAGLGGQKRLRKMYDSFLKFYPEEQTIDIIGFSRGAALAREFANVLNDRGYLPDYKNRNAKKACPVKIRFVGLFDTVGSFGLPGNRIDIGIRMALPGNVGHAAQAVALDEQRAAFPLTRLGKAGPGQIFNEKGFRGDHSDVGGGHKEKSNLLSITSLMYIHGEGLKAGVPFGYPDFEARVRAVGSYKVNETPHDLTRNWKYILHSNGPRPNLEGL